jgi:hypothetical protein
VLWQYARVRTARGAVHAHRPRHARFATADTSDVPRPRVARMHTLKRATELHNKRMVQDAQNGLLGEHVLHLRAAARTRVISRGGSTDCSSAARTVLRHSASCGTQLTCCIRTTSAFFSILMAHTPRVACARTPETVSRANFPSQPVVRPRMPTARGGARAQPCPP